MGITAKRKSRSRDPPSGTGLSKRESTLLPSRRRSLPWAQTIQMPPNTKPLHRKRRKSETCTLLPLSETVGDPLKDTSGPAINILVKLSAITSLVFGSYIKQMNLFGPRTKDVGYATAK